MFRYDILIQTIDRSAGFTNTIATSRVGSPFTVRGSNVSSHPCGPQYRRRRNERVIGAGGIIGAVNHPFNQ